MVIQDSNDIYFYMHFLHGMLIMGGWDNTHYCHALNLHNHYQVLLFNTVHSRVRDCRNPRYWLKIPLKICIRTGFFTHTVLYFLYSKYSTFWTVKVIYIWQESESENWNKLKASHLIFTWWRLYCSSISWLRIMLIRVLYFTGSSVKIRLGNLFNWFNYQNKWKDGPINLLLAC
jgi:hypothetical protein